MNKHSEEKPPRVGAAALFVFSGFWFNPGREPAHLIIGIGLLAMLAALILPRLRSTADSANRIRAAYSRAEAPVLEPGSDLRDVDQFARDLRAIDLTDAPSGRERRNGGNDSKGGGKRICAANGR